MTENHSRSRPEGHERPAPAAGSPSAGWRDLVLAFRWPLAVVLVALIGYLAYRATLDRASNAAATTIRAVSDAAQGLWSGNVTETFISSIPEFDPEGSGNLELATLTATETFTRSDERKILWDRFSLGVATSEIRVPVTYRYHLRLSDPWRLEIRGPVCLVWAPEIRPSLPPAIRTDRMEKRTEADWLRFDGDDQMDVLERSVTPTLERYARDDRHLGVVRENARRAVEEFVKNWLLREDQWGADRVHVIQVVFPDEVDEAAAPDKPLEIARPGE